MLITSISVKIFNVDEFVLF